MLDINDDSSDDYFNHRYRAQSTSHLLSNDSNSSKSVSPKPDRSQTSLINSKKDTPSFLKISSTSCKTLSSSPTEDRFVMTIIRSPSTSSQSRMLSTDSATTPTPTPTHEESSNNSKFFKSKVTAALNHMKYRKFR